MNAAESSIARLDRDRSPGDPEMQRHDRVRRFVKRGRFKLPPAADRSHGVFLPRRGSRTRARLRRSRRSAETQAQLP
jgi:hypothetical protein